MPEAAAGAKVMAFGDFSYYWIADRQGRAFKRLNVLYNCSASRPKIEGKTNEESREVHTETLTVKARPLASGYVKAKTGNRTSAETYEGWYKSVYLPEPKAVDADTEGQG